MNRKLENIFGSEHPDQSIGNLLVRLSNLHQRRINSELSKLNLTYVQFVLIAGIYWLTMDNQEITQVRLINLTKLDKSMTSSVLKKLIAKKLVVRNEHKIDTRAKILTITTEGKKVVQEAVTIVEQIDKDFFSIESYKLDELIDLFLQLVNKNESNK